MICYYHPDIIRSWHLQVLPTRVVHRLRRAYRRFLACKARHEDEVRGLNLMARRSVLQAKRVGSGYLRNAVFYALVGTLFAGFGLMQYRFLGLQAVFFMLIGLFLFYAAITNYLESRKYK